MSTHQATHNAETVAHYPTCKVGFLSCQARCSCGWAGRRTWLCGSAEISDMQEEYVDHAMYWPAQFDGTVS